MSTKGRRFFSAAGVLGAMLCVTAPVIAQGHPGGGGGHAGGGHVGGGGHAATGHFGGGAGAHYAGGAHYGAVGGHYGGGAVAQLTVIPAVAIPMGIPLARTGAVATGAAATGRARTTD